MSMFPLVQSTTKLKASWQCSATRSHSATTSGWAGTGSTLQNRFASRTRQIEVTFNNEPTLVIVRDDRRKGSYNLQVLLAVLIGKTTAGQTGKNSFAFKVTGEIDKNPVGITLDASHPGQIFDGLGGNFRLQNARIDP